MSFMEKMGKTGEQSNFKKWVVYGLFAVVAFMILREIFFWSIFNEVMSGVKAQTEAVQKRQAAIMAQAQQMQNKMDSKINSFQTSMQQQESKIKNNVDNFNKGAMNAENAFANSGDQFELRSKVADQVMYDGIDEKIENNIRDDAVKNHDYSKKYIELSPDEQQVVEKLIADYKAAHPNLMKTSGDPTLLKLSPQDHIVLIEMIRAYNQKIADKEKEKADEEDEQVYQGASVENFEKSRQKFNQNFNNTLNEINKNTKEITKDWP